MFISGMAALVGPGDRLTEPDAVRACMGYTPGRDAGEPHRLLEDCPAPSNCRQVDRDVTVDKPFFLLDSRLRLLPALGSSAGPFVCCILSG